MMKNMKPILIGLLLALASPLSAFAQCSGNAPASTYCGNPTGSLALPGWKPISSMPFPDIAGGTVVGNRGTTVAAATALTNPVLGIPGTSTGEIGFAGATSGTVTIKPQAAAGTFNFNLPTSAGTSGYVLLSGGGGSSPMTWSARSSIVENALSWFIVGSPDYPTIQSAITAASANNGGYVWIPCGTYNIGTALSSATGIDATSTKNVHVSGPVGPNGGAGQCAMINYLGTGTAVTYGGSIGLEWEHTYVRATGAAAKLFDGTTGSSANTTYAYFHDNIFVGSAGNTVIQDIASAVGAEFKRNVFASGTIGIRGITSGAGIAGGQFAVNVNISDTNVFQPTLTTAAIQGLETATVNGNIFQGQILGYSPGPAGTCLRLNWSNNWHGDATTPQPNVQTNCVFFNSSSNTYNQAGGTAVTQTNATGKVASKNDFFSTGTWINIGTGNVLTVDSMSPAGNTPSISGTPSQSMAAAVYGQLSVGNTNSALAQSPLTVASYGTATGAFGIALLASDYATNNGYFSINKDSGVAGAVHITASDAGMAPIVFDSGDVRIGGTFAGRRAGTLRMEGATSGTARILTQPVMGTPDLTLPTGTGTFAVSASAPLSLNATTGALTISSIPLSSLAAQTANTVVGNATSGSAAPTALAMPSCGSAATAALQWVTNTGFACNNSINAATLGGATFASPGIIGGTTPGAITGTTIVANTSIDSPVIRAAGTLTNINGGTGGNTVTLLLVGGSGANGGSTIQFGKNTSATITHYYGHNSAIFAGGSTSSDIVLYNAGTGGGLAGRVYTASNADNSVAFASTVDGTSGTGGAINTLGGIGATKAIWAGTSVTATTFASIGTKIRAAGSAPTLTAGCNGAGSSVSGSDLAGQVTGQTAAATTCTLTFNSAYSATPYCVVTGNSSPLTGVVTPSTGTIVVNFASTANYQFSYVCVARSAG